jgi:flavin reductase (DIM6/NTAB) family NADH-FMN oxidoreductase RutF
MASGRKEDKFKKTGLTPLKSELVDAPFIEEFPINIECKVIDIIKKYNIIILDAVAAYVDTSRKEKRTIHAVGDGTFIVDGRKFDRKKLMASKIPNGL